MNQYPDDSNRQPGNNAAILVIAVVGVLALMLLLCAGVGVGLFMFARVSAQQAMQMQQAAAQQALAQQQRQQQAMPGVPVPSSPALAPYQLYQQLAAAGRYSEALASLDAAIQLDENLAVAHNDKAWLLATCPDKSVRNGTLAVEHATKACELTNWTNGYFVDTLAAAHAELGNFTEAVKWQQEALKQTAANNPQFVGMRQRLRRFEEGKPHREKFGGGAVDEEAAADPTGTTGAADEPKIELTPPTASPVPPRD